MKSGTSPAPSAAPSPLERAGAVLFTWRNWLFTVGLLALLAGFRPVPFLGSHQADLWLDLVGVGLVLAGQLLRILVIGSTPIESGGQRKQVAAQRLVTAGLLNHARNPLYIGNILVMGGLVTIHNHPWVYGIGLPVTLFSYCAIVAAEEAFLSGRFGEEYAEYRRRVPRWLPKLHGLGATLRGLSIDWRRVLLQEYGSIYIALAFPLALMLYQEFVRPASIAVPDRRPVLIALFVLVTLGWAYLRRLKLQEVARRRREKAASAGVLEGR